MNRIAEIEFEVEDKIYTASGGLVPGMQNGCIDSTFSFFSVLKCTQILGLQDLDKLAFKTARWRKPLALTNFFKYYLVG